jgi:hypothetical protein
LSRLRVAGRPSHVDDVRDVADPRHRLASSEGGISPTYRILTRVWRGLGSPSISDADMTADDPTPLAIRAYNHRVLTADGELDRLGGGEGDLELVSADLIKLPEEPSFLRLVVARIHVEPH